MRPGRTILLNPILPVALTFGVGFLVWYLYMPDTSLVIGIASRHESATGYFRFFLFFSIFLFGMLFANGRGATQGLASSMDNRTWLRIGWATTAMVLGADYLYLRSGIGELTSATSYVDAIHGFTATVHDNASLGVTSLNNLFPLPLTIGLTIAMADRVTARTDRIQGAAMASIMLLMTLGHGATGFGRIWFLFSMLTVFIVWVIERRPRLVTQIAALTATATLGVAFIVVMELLRNVGLTAQATNLDFTDPRIIRLAFLTLSQAYVASDVNNAMIVLDCPAAGYMVSTFDVIARLFETGLGAQFPPYSTCPGWTSMFGTTNFLALIWWDWGHVAPIILLAIGYGIQICYIKAIGPTQGVSFAAILFPNILFGAVHLTRTMFIGSTQFLLPCCAILVLYAVYRLGVPRPRTATA